MCSVNGAWKEILDIPIYFNGLVFPLFIPFYVLLSNVAFAKNSVSPSHTEWKRKELCLFVHICTCGLGMPGSGEHLHP